MPAHLDEVLLRDNGDDSDDHDDDDGDDQNATLSRILVYSNIETCTICNVIFQYLHFLIIPIFDEVKLQISEQLDIHLLFVHRLLSLFAALHSSQGGCSKAISWKI